MMNKLQTIAVMAIMFLLTACNKEATDTPQTDEGGWMPSVTRTTTGGATFNKDILISGIKDIADNAAAKFAEVFLASSNNWENDVPNWPVGDSLHLIATCPTDYSESNLPTIVTNGSDAPLMAGYIASTTRPTTSISFTMTHLMAQLKVHIKVEGGSIEPTDATVKLYKCKSIDYTTLKVSPYTYTDTETDKQEDFPLGTFTGSGGDYASSAFNIIPQTLAATGVSISFKVDGANYTFTPAHPIDLKAGKLTRIYLGASFEEKVVQLIGAGVIIEDWETGDNLPDGETEEAPANASL